MLTVAPGPDSLPVYRPYLLSVEIPMLRLMTLCLPVVLLAPALSPAAETLRMKFEEGETYGYLIDQQMTVEATVQGKDVQSQLGQKLTINTKIVDVNDDGSARAEQTIDRVQMKMQFPDPESKTGESKTVEYDTASQEVPEDQMAKGAAENISRMVGKAIAMTISSTGEMTDIAVPEELKPTQQGAAAPGSQLEDTFKQSGLRLPKEPVSEGDTWDQKIELTLPFGVMKINTTYTYRGKNSDNLDQIEADMDVELEPKKDAQVQVKATAKEAKGDFLFDNQTGKLVESNIAQILDIELGGIARQRITTVVKMTLADGPAE